MEMLISDPAMRNSILRERKETRADRRDEIWDGTYIVFPLADNEHQELQGMLLFALQVSVRFAKLGLIRMRVNISDQTEKWRKNVRCPDVAVFLNSTTAVNKNTHWFGGPDFAAEIISPYDKTREKFDFYANVGVRELLLVDRQPWALELYRLQDGVLVLVGKSDLNQPNVLVSEVVPLTFQLAAGDPRPTIEMFHADGVQRWSA
jgi:Uma2 family endonuclease